MFKWPKWIKFIVALKLMEVFREQNDTHTHKGEYFGVYCNHKQKKSFSIVHTWEQKINCNISLCISLRIFVCVSFTEQYNTQKVICQSNMVYDNIIRAKRFLWISD